MTLTQDLSEMLDALHRAKQDLNESLSPFLDADPPYHQSLAHLDMAAARNARSATLIDMILLGQATDGVLQALWRSEVGGAMGNHNGQFPTTEMT